ncbi:hypothetical protein Sjap_013410 [Stephania japonica]|uniref:Uncharacterized protein n=1 Tax=Stephania japonica TaxID=461633 RepID=A0AAP0IY17_9MAGN
MSLRFVSHLFSYPLRLAELVIGGCCLVGMASVGVVGDLSMTSMMPRCFCEAQVVPTKRFLSRGKPYKTQSLGRRTSKFRCGVKSHRDENEQITHQHVERNEEISVEGTMGPRLGDVCQKDINRICKIGKFIDFGNSSGLAEVREDRRFAVNRGHRFESGGERLAWGSQMVWEGLRSIAHTACAVPEGMSNSFKWGYILQRLCGTLELTKSPNHDPRLTSLQMWESNQRFNASLSSPICAGVQDSP